MLFLRDLRCDHGDIFLVLITIHLKFLTTMLSTILLYSFLFCYDLGGDIVAVLLITLY